LSSFDKPWIWSFFIGCINRFTIRQFALHKNEKVKKRKQIAKLFDSGISISMYPLRLHYELVPVVSLPGASLPADRATLQFGVSVSKRHFKKAVDRNRVKRLLREAYRLQRQPLLDTLEIRQCCLSVFFIFTGKELPAYEEVLKSVSVALTRLQKQVLKLQ
jgi:ribonuclease P protein component